MEGVEQCSSRGAQGFGSECAGQPPDQEDVQEVKEVDSSDVGPEVHTRQANQRVVVEVRGGAQPATAGNLRHDERSHKVAKGRSGVDHVVQVVVGEIAAIGLLIDEQKQDGDRQRECKQQSRPMAAEGTEDGHGLYRLRGKCSVSRAGGHDTMIPRARLGLGLGSTRG